MKEFKKKLQYWFDNQMAKGPGSMILMLAAVTFVVLLILIGLINLFEPSEDGLFATCWDTLSSIINAWMPYSGDGGIGYLIPTGIAALFGLLFTSVLIGIIATAIEEKITSLKKGNSVVAERDHTVILGFEPGAYELINQLIEAAGDGRLCLVVAGDGERDETEEDIRNNIEIPRNVKLIYRHVDICDATALKCCSIETADTVIINTYDNHQTVKAILATVKALREYPEAKVNIVASVSKDEYSLPDSFARKKNVSMVQTNDVIARLIAHSCSQPGISQTFLEVLNFSGAELYVDSFDEYVGKSFGELYQRLEKGVPIGFVTDNKADLMPDQDAIYKEGSKLVYLAEEHKGLILSSEGYEKTDLKKEQHVAKIGKTVAIFGYNEKINTLINELPDHIEQIIALNVPEEEKERYSQVVGKKGNMAVRYVDRTELNNDTLEEITENIDHAILLSDHDIDREQADIQNMMLYLKLIDIEITCGRKFNITTELFYENNKELITSNKTTDFVVANNMSSLLVAQMAVTPELKYVFDELLSNEGVEIRVLNPNESEFNCKTTYELRREALSYGTLLIGYIKNNNGKMETRLNPGLKEEISLGKDDLLIGIC